MTLYRRAKLEKFALYLQSDGLLTRLTTYKDLSCECLWVQEKYVQALFPLLTMCVLKALRWSW